MMWYEMADIVFFIKEHKHPTERFNINNYVSFSTLNRYEIIL